jgi:hypothetical protein
MFKVNNCYSFIWVFPGYLRRNWGSGSPRTYWAIAVKSIKIVPNRLIVHATLGYGNLMWYRSGWGHRH